jgi:nicotinamide-nucleotide amidase
LIRHQKTVAVAESCTGGKLAHLLTSVPGSSRAFKGGWVTYTNEVKEKIASVPAEYLNEYGAISAQTAELMARNTLECFDSDFALGVTGVAGPDPAEGKPVGTVYIGLAEKGQPVRVYQFALKGSRRRIQLLAANHALFVLEQCLKKGETTR